MNCKQCKSKWTPQGGAIITWCPYCGAKVDDPMINIENKDPHDILLGIALRYEKDKLADPLLKGLIADLMSDEKDQYIRIFKQAVDDKIGARLLEIENEDNSVKVAKIQTLRSNFKEKNGFNNTALYVFDSFLYALGWKETVVKENYFLDSPDGLGIISEQLDLAIIDGSLKKEEILSVFIYAEKLGIPEDDIVELIRKKIKALKLKPYSVVDRTLKTHKEVLCSCDWFTESIPGSYGEITTAEGDEYKGELLVGLPHGKGVLNCLNGDKYDGEFIKGKKHGKGICTYANLVTYKGDWENDLPNGRGIYRWPRGSKYTGEVRNGKRHGKGTLTNKDGWRYYGTWVDDNMIEEHLKRNNRRIEAFKDISYEDYLLNTTFGGIIFGIVMGIIYCIIAQRGFVSYLYIPLIWAAVTVVILPLSLSVFSNIMQSDLFQSLFAIGIHSLALLIISAVLFYTGSLNRNNPKLETKPESANIVIDVPVDTHLLEYNANPETSARLEGNKTDVSNGSHFPADIVTMDRGTNSADIEIHSSFWKKSVNKANLLSVYRYMNRGKTDKILSLITDDSYLDMILYAKRFFRQDKLFNRSKYLAQFNIIDVREFWKDSTFTYLIIELQLLNPRQYDSGYSFERISESLSPWIKPLGNGFFRDSIPVINGLVEFNYGKDKGLSELSLASKADVKVNWLNVREAPSLNAGILGKLKAQKSGDWHGSGGINDIVFQDFNHTVFVDIGSDANGFVRCYVIDELSGKYEQGFVWKEHLNINDYVWKGRI